MFFKEGEHYFLYIGALMMPTCIAQIIPRLTRKNTAPYSTFFYCICCNVGFGFLISYFLDETRTNKALVLILSIVFLTIGYLPQFIPFSICCCPTSFECNNQITCTELFHKFEDHDEFCRKLSQNRIFAPVITVFSEASHEETYTVQSVDSKGRVTTHRRSKTVVTYRNQQEFHYNSWQEEGNAIRIWPGTTVIHTVITPSFKFDSEADRAFKWLRDFMYSDALRHDAKAVVNVQYEIPGMVKNLCGTSISDKKKIPCFVTFLTSFFGKIFLLLMSLIGYQSIVSAIWCSYGERLRLKLVKKMSMKPKCAPGGGGRGGLRAGYLEKDMDAIQNAFHTDSIEAPMNVPLINNGEQYNQPLDYSPYNNAYVNSPYYQTFVQNNYQQTESYNVFPEVDPNPYLLPPPN